MNIKVHKFQIPNNVIVPWTEPWTKDIGPQRQKARRGCAWVVPHISIPTHSCLSINACKLGPIFVFVNVNMWKCKYNEKTFNFRPSHKLQAGFHFEVLFRVCFKYFFMLLFIATRIAFVITKLRRSYCEFWRPFFLLLFYSTQLRTTSWRLEVYLQHLSPS